MAEDSYSEGEDGAPGTRERSDEEEVRSIDMMDVVEVKSTHLRLPGQFYTYITLARTLTFTYFELL